MQIKITKFSDLIKLIEDYDLNDEQIMTLLSSIPSPIYMGKPMRKPELVEKLKEYWQKYQGPGEKPLFLD